MNTVLMCLLFKVVLIISTWLKHEGKLWIFRQFKSIACSLPTHCPTRVLTDTSHFMLFIIANGICSMKFIWNSFLISLMALLPGASHKATSIPLPARNWHVGFFPNLGKDDALGGVGHCFIWHVWVNFVFLFQYQNRWPDRIIGNLGQWNVE